MNVGGVNEVAPPGASKPPLSNGVASTAPGKGQGLEAFLSLLGELIEIPSPAAGQPSPETNGSGSNAANPKSKNALSGGKNSNSGKKDESNAKLALIQSVLEPAPSIVKPPLVLTIGVLATQSVSEFHSETDPGSEAQRGGGFSIAAGTKSPVEASAPAAAAPGPKAVDIAFGLRLTSANPAIKTDATVSDPQPPQESNPKPTASPVTSIPVRIVAAPAPGTMQVGDSISRNGRTAASSPFLTTEAPRTSVAASVASDQLPQASVLGPPQHSPDRHGEYETGRESNSSGTTGSRPISFDTQTPEIPQASRTLPDNTEKITASTLDKTITPNTTSRSEPANQRVEINEQSTLQSGQQPAMPRTSTPDAGGYPEASPAGVPEIETIPDVQRAATNDIADRSISSRSTSSRPYDNRQDVSASRAPAALREVSPRSAEEDKSQDEPNSNLPRPKVTVGETGPKRTTPATSNSEGEQRSASFQPSIQTATASRTPDAEPETTVASGSQPVAKVETGHEINPTSQPQPARQISLKLTGPDSAKVDVELSEKGGKVQVAVRTADRELAKSLQGDLGDLVGRLETKGFKTEAWIPGAAHVTHASAAAEPSSAGQGNHEHSGGGADQQPGRQGRNASNQRQQARWMTQLQESMSTEETRSENE